MIGEGQRDCDYVIVGGGSAGCVLAARLSEDPSVTVTLLEAGTAAPNPLIEIPAAMRKLIGNPQYDWVYKSEPDASLKGRRTIWHAGRMLGGGSSINGMIYIRGRHEDYDEWAKLGCTGWGWHEVEPYFRRAEGYTGDGNPSLGRDGPQPVEPLRSYHPLARTVVGAGVALGYPLIDDHNAGDITGEGMYYALGSQKRGMRASTARSYLMPAVGRSNLTVLRGAQARDVVIEDGCVAGVRYDQDGEIRTIGVRREAIMCAGTVQSPLMLLRSGVGPAEYLRDRGIGVQVARNAVGGNVQEHLGFNVPRFVNVPTYNSDAKLHRGIKHALNYLFRRRGALAAPSVQVMGWVRSSPEKDFPDLQLSWLPFAMDTSGSVPKLYDRPAVLLGGVVTKPFTRGRVALHTGNDIMGPPSIDFPMMGDERDVRALVAGVRLCEKFYATRPLADYVEEAAPPFLPGMSDEEIADTLRTVTGTGLHCVGSCRMGSDDDAVVDTQLRVRGVGGLRIADASVMPLQISSNTNATVIMIAERAADMIKTSARAHAPSQREGAAA